MAIPTWHPEEQSQGERGKPRCIVGSGRLQQLADNFSGVVSHTNLIQGGAESGGEGGDASWDRLCSSSWPVPLQEQSWVLRGRVG